MNLNSLLFSQSACKHLQHKSASYIYMYLPPIHDMIDIPQLLIDRMVHPRTHFFGLSTSSPHSYFSPRFATINRNPTYSQSGCFLLHICVRVICSTASTILLLARRPADISTILHPCCFRYLRLTWWLAFRSHATSYFRFCIPPVF